MSSQASNAQVLQIFKKVYGDITELVPSGLPVSEEISFSAKEKVGDKFVEAVTLTAETGITFGGATADLFDINPAIAGTVRQAEVAPYMSVIASVIPWGVISRSAGGTEKAFTEATKHVVKNNIKSHMRLLEIVKMVGQHPYHLGRVTYAPSGTVYRGATYSGDGNIVLVSDVYGSVTFTAGINAASKLILLQPGDFAAGFWVGHEGITIQELDSNNAVVATGSLVSYDADLGIIQVSFTPTAASAISSNSLAFLGMADAKEMVGMKKILTNTGSLFGINAASYPLWKGNTFNAGAKLLTISNILTALSNGINKGGIEGDLVLFCNNRSFASLTKAAAALRRYDSSYKAEVDEGADSIKVHYQQGTVTVKPSRFCMEGEAYILTLEDWINSGSAQVSFTVPGMPNEVIFPLEQQAGYMFRSFSDQYMLCKAPARSIFIYNINDESAT